MIYIAYESDGREAGELVNAAFCRAFTKQQIVHIEPRQLLNLYSKNTPLCVVIISSSYHTYGDFLKAAEAYPPGVKIAIFGHLPSAELIAPLTDYAKEAASDPAPCHTFAESLLRVQYQKSLGALASPILDRSFLRYDFMNEWNNLGFGAITCDGSIWSLSQIVAIDEDKLLAAVYLGDQSISAYAGYWDTLTTSTLWFNRLVGPIDSQEWRLVEYFFASYRHAELPCVPVISEIPYGYDAAVTMRLDCDEDIESSRSLMNAYQECQVPFSLAIHTAVLRDAKHIPIMQQVLKEGGAILSHSNTHPVNWGGSYEAALEEATASALLINQAMADDFVVRYAVSPFHHTPDYALHALQDAGYAGCVGGVINCNPEFIFARGGMVWGCHADFIGHTQSCMLHGDCLLTEGDALGVYKQAFTIAKNGRALFGYLDHPFSERYAYGWKSEAERVAAHVELIQYIRTQGNVLFLNEQAALDFIYDKNATNISLDSQGHLVVELPALLTSSYPLAVEYRDQIINLMELGISA